MLRIITALVFLWTGAASAQALGDIGTGMAVLENFNESTLDRFGNPTFGLRAQREPNCAAFAKCKAALYCRGRSVFLIYLMMK